MSSGYVLGHSRLHFGLADVGTATLRRYGGIGVVVERPCTRVRWRGAGRLSILGVPGELVEHARQAAGRLEAMLGRPLTGTAEITASPEPHVGHGSKTSGVLAVLRAVALASAADIPDATLIAASGRGGTSGVGVHGFFGGGVVVDAGHRPDGRPIGPSGATAPSEPPLLLQRADWPAVWGLALVRPANADGKHGAREAAFFASNAPLPGPEALSALAAIHHGVLPAVLTKDIDALGHALDRLAAAGFKQREMQAQPPAVRELLAALRQSGAPAGMSSLGPLLFAVVPATDAHLRQAVERAAQAAGAAVVWTQASTSGHVLLDDEDGAS